MDEVETDTGSPLHGGARNEDPRASEELFPLVYAQLKQIARQRMAMERKDHTLGATALVHEAYLRIVGDGEVEWPSRLHFFRAAAEAMRRILIEHARARGGLKRGGGRRRRVPLNALDLADERPGEEILSLDDAISRLEQISASAAEVVRLRFYAGLSVAETAQAMGVSQRTVERDWSCARAWLYRELDYE